MQIFNAGDAIQFAIRIEENGKAFYQKAAGSAQTPELRDLFNVLADEELQHKTFFQDMFSKMEYIPGAEQYDGEYDSYLRNYIDGMEIFTEEARKTLEANSKDVLSTLTFAMRIELDSILYYHEIRQLVADKYHPIMGKIISEERKHYSKLSNERKKYI